MSSSGPETKLVKKMLDAAKAEYGEKQVLIKHHGGPYSRAGVSDIIGPVYGTFVAVEVKAPESYGGSIERALREGPTVKQREYVRKVLVTGGVAGFAVTVEQFMEILACAAGGYYCTGHWTDPDNLDL